MGGADGGAGVGRRNVWTQRPRKVRCAQVPFSPAMYRWTKRVAARNADAWTGRLEAACDPSRLAVVTPAAGRSVRLEVYCDTEREAVALAGVFGGVAGPLRDESWLPAPHTAPGRPLSIGGRLLVTGRGEELAGLRSARPGVPVLFVPAAMAFGTGDHATTAMCLRLLLEVSRQRAPGTWDVLDLGTGSGILALAGVLLGARHGFGLDNDPHAVRTARENARLNGIGARRVRFARAELPDRPRTDRRTWPVVTANLFSELLIRLMPEVIAPAVALRGDLILSGVLATQTDEVVAAVRSAGLTLVQTKARGRWRAFHCRRV